MPAAQAMGSAVKTTCRHRGGAGRPGRAGVIATTTPTRQRNADRSTRPAGHYVSFHPHPLYRHRPCDGDRWGDGRGRTVNIPLPPGRRAQRTGRPRDGSRPWPEVRANGCYVGRLRRHRADLTDLELSAGDFADMTAEIVGLVRWGSGWFPRGGYDLGALRDRRPRALACLAGERLHEGRAPTGVGRAGTCRRGRPRPQAGGRKVTMQIAATVEPPYPRNGCGGRPEV